MPIRPTTSPASRRVLGLLTLFVLAVGMWDYLAISFLGDTILSPLRDGGQVWVKLGDWSAIQCYADNWQTALLRWTSNHVSDAVLTAVIVLALHGLLWSGIYYFSHALFGGALWVALLAVALVRISPDLFQVHLLSAQSPSRLAAIALAFWSSGLTVRRRWVTACCAAGLIAHFSPTVACWFVQFILVTLFCLNHEWGWRKSLIGAACFLAIAGGPLVEFLVEDVIPGAPIPNSASDAMVGLHFFADPTLSPFSVPLWAYVCLVVYLAMAFVWLKQHFSRRRTPVVIIFFLLGLAGLLLDVIFVGVIPIERAARFELQTMRAFWFLWIAVFYAPQLADEIGVLWEKGKAWWPIFRGLSFSLPLVWSGITLLERLYHPPRWNRVVVFPMVLLLFLTIHPGDRPIAEPVYALVIATAIAAVATVAALVGRVRGASNLARATAIAASLFAVSLLFLDRATLGHAFSESRRIMARDTDWAEACRWVAENSPADSTWSVPWRPRQFRLWTGRAVLINRNEAPSDPSRRFEWFQMYAETHEWPNGVGALSLSLPGGERIIEWLREYRRRFLVGAAQSAQARSDRLVCASALPQGYRVHYAICERELPPLLVQDHGNIRLERLHTVGPFELYRIGLTAAKP